MTLTSLARKALLFVLIAAGLYGVLAFSFTACLKINYPYMVNLGEPPLSQAIHSVLKGKIPYRELSSPPYSLVPYGPVYLYLAVFLSRLPGLSSGWAGAPFVVGRLLTLASTFLAAGFIYLILRKDKVRRIFAVIPALFFISHPYVMRWGVQVNVDMMGVSLALTSFYFLWCHVLEDQKDRRQVALGIFLSVIAFFTKSSMIACPAAFFWFLVFQRKFKKAAVFFLLMGVLTGTIYFWLNHWTHGAYFFHTTYEIGKRHFFPIFIGRFWLLSARQAPLLVASSLFGLAGLVRGGKRSFAFLYLFFVLLMTVTLGKQGSDTNYFLEWLALSSLTLGWMLESFAGLPEGPQRSFFRPWVASVVVGFFLCQIVAWIYPYRDLSRVTHGYKASKDFFDRISLIVQRTKGKILSADMSLLTANDREIFYEPFPMGQMSYSGVWDERLILKELDEKNIALIILFFYAPPLKADRNFTIAFMDMFKKRYEFVGRAVPPPDMDPDLGGHTLFFYVPKKDASL